MHYLLFCNQKVNASMLFSCYDTPMSKSVRIHDLAAMKQSSEKIAMLTVYDATFARVFDTAGIDILFVGDSVGTTVAGFDSTVPVTMEDMVYHTRCVARGVKRALLLADLPFMSYATTQMALENATRLMQAGAAMVKLEGGAWVCDAVEALVLRGIPVCGHLGLTPQSVHQLSGYKVQGKTVDSAKQLLKDAKALQAAGLSLLVLECVPSQLAAKITAALDIPVIGIGAGPDCDGQVLVMHDMLGVTPGKSFKFVKNFLEGNVNGVAGAVSAYCDAVKSGRFPDQSHSFDG